MGFTTYYHRRRKSRKSSGTNTCLSSQLPHLPPEDIEPLRQNWVKENIMFYEQLGMSPATYKDLNLMPFPNKNTISESASTTKTAPINPSKVTECLCPGQIAPPMKYVYVVKQEVVLHQPLSIITERDQIIAIYTIPRDANLRVYKIVKQRRESGECFGGFDVLEDAEGLLSWSTFQHGSSKNGIYVYVDRMEVLPTGSESDED